MLRGLILIVGAAFALSAVSALVVVKVGSDLANGLPLEGSDFGILAVFGGGGALVLGITGRTVWRERASVAWAAYGAIVAAAALVGAGGGATLGWRIAGERVEYVRGRAAETCAAFVAVHPMPEAECEAREMACEQEVQAHPPVVARGLGGVTAPIDPGAPTEPHARAVWECLGGR
jgi:hypothetical protein